jgi:CBS domain-containing protein
MAHAQDETVTVDEIMTRNIITVAPDTPVDDVARLLSVHDISGVPVVDDDGAGIGMISELDVITKSGQIAGDIMSRGLISVSEDTPAVEVANILNERRVRRVPVLQGSKIIGIVSRSDLLRLFSMTRWTCEDCGLFVRGFTRPEQCDGCGSTKIVLEREPPGM